MISKEIEELVAAAANALQDIAWLEIQINQANEMVGQWISKRGSFEMQVDECRARYSECLEKIREGRKLD